MTPVVILAHHPDLDKRRKQFEEQLLFLKKQHEAFNQKADDMKKDFWRDIETYLEEHDIIEKPSKKNMIIKDGVIYECQKDEGDFFSLLKNLLK